MTDMMSPELSDNEEDMDGVDDFENEKGEEEENENQHQNLFSVNQTTIEKKRIKEVSVFQKPPMMMQRQKKKKKKYY